MNNTAKWIIGLIILALVIWAIVARGHKQNNNSSVESGTYKIGAMVPLTGEVAEFGEEARGIYQIAVDEINNSGGINGKKLELIVEDSKCNGKDGANAAQKLMNVDKVQVVIGGFCSSESLSAIPVAESAKVAMLSPGSSSPDLTSRSKFFFRNYPSDASQGSVLADIAYNKQNMKKVAFLQEQLDYPLGIFKAFSAKFESLGGAIAGKEEYKPDTSDFRSQLAKLRATNPDALFIDSNAPAATQRIIKQLQDMQWKPKIFLADTSMGDAKTLLENKDILEGAIGAEFNSDPNNSKLSTLIDFYKNKYSKDVKYPNYAQTEYDAVFLVKDAITAVGYDGEKIADWGHSVSNWPGASGSVTIGSNGDRVGGHSPEIIHNGVKQPYQ